jgi:hypothetical protein
MSSACAFTSDSISGLEFVVKQKNMEYVRLFHLMDGISHVILQWIIRNYFQHDNNL